MELKTWIDTARGKCPADLVIKNVTMLMVSAGEWVRGDLAIAGDRIIGAGPEPYVGRRTLDGDGLFAVPGFIDTHVHIESSHVLPAAFEEAVLPRGTTTAICDPHELANVCGLNGIRFFLDCAETLSLDLIVQLSSCVPATALETSGAVLTAEDLASLKGMPRAGGLAEMMDFPGLLHKDPGVLAKISAFADTPVDGHAPFLDGYDLNAYCGCGIGNDHECSTIREAMERIRRGMTVLIREGSVAKNLRTLASVITPQTVDFTALCTDDRNILDILREGHIDFMIRALIAEGIAPELVYRAASLSAARCFRLFDRGMLAPGKLADIVLLDDVKRCGVRTVFKRGQEIVPGRRLAKSPDCPFAAHSMKRGPIRAADLRIFSSRSETPVMEIVPGTLVTKHLDLSIPPDQCGEKHPSVSQDVAKICVVARHGINKNIGKGFVRGLGLQSGAIASSVGHDSHNICVAGTDDEDMAVAVNALLACGGGYAAVNNGKLLGQVSFPVGGLMSDKRGTEVAAELDALHHVMRETGCRLENPFMQLSFLTLPVIPSLKITDKGVFDTERSAFLEL